MEVPEGLPLFVESVSIRELEVLDSYAFALLFLPGPTYFLV